MKPDEPTDFRQNDLPAAAKATQDDDIDHLAEAASVTDNVTCANETSVCAEDNTQVRAG